MKVVAGAFATLLLITTAVAGWTAQGNQDPTIVKFWDDFKAAVNTKNVEAVAALTNFPIAMPYGIPSVKNKTQLRQRYKQVFAQQSNAAACFKKAHPEMEAQDPNTFTVTCADQAGNEVVVYRFTKMKSGWKLVGLDNLNE